MSVFLVSSDCRQNRLNLCVFAGCMVCVSQVRSLSGAQFLPALISVFAGWWGFYSFCNKAVWGGLWRFVVVRAVKLQSNFRST